MWEAPFFLLYLRSGQHSPRRMAHVAFSEFEALRRVVFFKNTGRIASCTGRLSTERHTKIGLPPFAHSCAAKLGTLAWRNLRRETGQRSYSEETCRTKTCSERTSTEKHHQINLHREACTENLRSEPGAEERLMLIMPRVFGASRSCLMLGMFCWLVPGIKEQACVAESFAPSRCYFPKEAKSACQLSVSRHPIWCPAVTWTTKTLPRAPRDCLK